MCGGRGGTCREQAVLDWPSLGKASRGARGPDSCGSLVRALHVARRPARGDGLGVCSGPRSGCPRLRGGCNVDPRAVLGSGAGLWPLRAFGEQLRAPSPQREESCPVLSAARRPQLEGRPLNRQEDRGKVGGRGENRELRPGPFPDGWVTGRAGGPQASSPPCPPQHNSVAVRTRHLPALQQVGGRPAGVLEAPLSGQPEPHMPGGS